MKKLSFSDIFKLIPSLFLFWGLLVNVTLGGPPSAGSFTLPQYEKFTLDNGLTVYLIEQHEVPLIYVSSVFPAGSVKDGDNFGLASLTADALLFGTSSYTKGQIEETLDFLGATYETSASREAASVTMSFVNTDQDKVFPILKDIIVNPVFDSVEFDKRKTRLLLELERAKERPSRVIGSYFNKFLYEDNVYGNPVSGTRKSVANITNDDAREFYLANYIPAESAIAIAGDFNSKNMKQKVQKLFSDWKREGSFLLWMRTGFSSSTRKTPRKPGSGSGVSVSNVQAPTSYRSRWSTPFSEAASPPG